LPFPDDNTVTKFNETFPLRYLINLGRRDDRRLRTANEFAKVGIDAERFPAVDARKIEAKLRRQQAENPPQFDGAIESLSSPDEVRGYEDAGRYALALTQRLAIRAAQRLKAPAVLLLEDDVVFHPNFLALFETIELPEDWGIFYLGCSHREAPSWAGPRIVRCSFSVDTHAVAIRSTHYDAVIRKLDRHLKDDDQDVPKASDQYLALLHKEAPSYACYPNLAWQDLSGSDLTGHEYSNYTSDGRQRIWTHVISDLFNQAMNPESTELAVPEVSSDRDGQSPGRTPPSVIGGGTARPKVGLLFLTRGDVNHPDIWREFLDGAREHVRIFSHPKEPSHLAGGFLEGTAISDHFETTWGTVSLVRASRALLLHALEDPTLTHFVLLSESCVPVLPLAEILRRLQLDSRSQFGFQKWGKTHPGRESRSRVVPGIPSGCWRFTSQWWLLDRAAATVASGYDYTSNFEAMFAPDESYFGTVLALQGYPLDGEVLNADVTWTSWKAGEGSPEEWPNVTQEMIRSIVHSGAMFARKFPVGADIGKLGLHRSAQLSLGNGKYPSPILETAAG
jgi:hypothetical protein